MTILGATPGPDNITGTAGDDVIEGGAGDDTINGGGGADRICGEGDDDLINGEGGNDQLDGGPNGTSGDTVTFLGTANGIVADLLAGTASEFVSTETDTLAGFENLRGSNTFDRLTGDNGPNVIEGLAAADLYSGGGGDDTLIDTVGGSSDQDTARYLDATGPITGSLTTNTVTGPGVGTDTLAGLLGIDGSPYDDILIGDSANPFPGSTQNVLDGMGGNDLLEPLAGTDNVYGGDTSFGGGPGIDTISYANDTAVVVDMTAGTAITNTVADQDEFSGVENVIGSSEADTITGNSSDNTIDGRAGGDALDGGGGTDTASFAGITQGVDADLALDTAAGQGADTIPNFENLTGSALADVLKGDAQANTILGLDGADQVTGGAAADLLRLGSGPDTVTANDGFADTIDCENLGPDSGAVDGPAPAEVFLQCDNDGDSLVDFLDACATQAGTGADGCPTQAAPAALPPPVVKVKRCKKGFKKVTVKGKVKCKRKKKRKRK